MATSCKIKYIDEAPVDALDPETELALKATLAEEHLKGMRLIDGSTISKDDSRKLFYEVKYFNGKQLRVLSPTNQILKEQQLERIEEINNQLIDDINSWGIFNEVPDYKPVRTIKADLHGKGGFDVVVIDLSPYITQAQPYFTEESFNKPSSLELLTQSMSKEFFQPNYIKKSFDFIDELGKIELETPDGDLSMITQNLNDFLNNLDEYRQNIVYNKDRLSEFPVLKEEINALYRSLRATEKEMKEIYDETGIDVTYRTKAVEKISNMTAYLKRTYKVLNGLDIKLKNTARSLAKDIENKDSENYLDSVKRLGNILNESTYLMEVAAPIESILFALRKDLEFSFWDSYNTVGIENAILERFPGEKALSIFEVFNNDYEDLQTLKPGLMVLKDENNDLLLTDDEVKIILDIFNEYEFKGKNLLHESFNSFGTLFSSLKEDLASFHKEYLTNILYNEQLKALNVNNFDEISPKIKSKALTKNQIETYLSKGIYDIDVINKLFSGIEGMNDPILRLFGGFLNNQLRLDHMRNQQDLAGDHDFLKTLDLHKNEEKRKQLESLFIEEKIYIDPFKDLVEADQEWIESGKPTLAAFGRVYQASKSLGFVEEFNNHDYKFVKKAFHDSIDSRINDLKDYLNYEGKITSIDLSTVKPQVIRDLNLLENEGIIVFDKNSGEIYFTDKQMEEQAYTPFRLKALFRDRFYSDYQELAFSFDEISQNFSEKYDINSGTDLARTLNEKVEPKFFNEVFRNNYREVKLRSEIEGQKYFKNTLQSSGFGSIYNGGVLLKKKDGSYFYVNSTDSIFNSKGKFNIVLEDLKDEYETMIVMANDFYKPSDKFRNTTKYPTLVNTLILDPVANSYHNFLTQKYEESNKRLGTSKFHYGILPKVAEAEQRDFIQSLKSLGSVEGWKELKEKYAYKVPDTQLISETEVRKQEGDHTYRQVTPLYTKDLKDGLKQFDDLFELTKIFRESTRSFKSLSTAESPLKAFKSMLNSKSVIGLEKRTTLEKGKVGVIHATLRKFFEKESPRSTEALISWMDRTVYGFKNDYNVFGLSARKLIDKWKFLISFQFLSGNIVASVSNVGIAAIESFGLAMGNKYGINDKVIRQSYAEYLENSPNFIADEFKENPAEMTLISQLMIHFNAIKGAVDNGMEAIDKRFWQKRFVNKALFVTQTIPEHLNQGSLFLAAYKVFEVADAVKDKDGKVLKEKLFLKDIINHTPGEAFKFDLNKLNERRKELGLDVYTQKHFEEQVETRFYSWVTDILRETQGQYDMLDESEFQNGAISSMAYMFSRWMYPGFRSKWGKDSGLINYRTGIADEEGYMRTFFKEMINDYNKIGETAQHLSTIEKVKEVMKANNITTTAQVAGNHVLKMVLGPITKLSVDFFGGNTTIEQWLFDSKLEEDVRQRLTRAYRYAGLWHSTILAAFVFRAIAEGIIEDDDDPLFTMLKALELQATRLNSDSGFYLNPVTFADKAFLKYRDPFTIWRSYDSTSGLFKQLLGIEYDPEKPDGQRWNMRYDDVYEKSGVGYEKGDSKAWVKFRKTFLAPYNQWLKLMNPEDQLQYMNMIYNN